MLEKPSENMERLFEYRNKFECWDDKRVKKIFNRLVKGEVCTFSTTSLETADQNVTEIQRIVTDLKKSNHFADNQTVKTITQYVFYFWESIWSVLTIDNSKDEFAQFNEWFIDLTETDCDNKGLCWADDDNCFITEWGEFTKEYSHMEMLNLLEAEGLI